MHNNESKLNAALYLTAREAVLGEPTPSQVVFDHLKSFGHISKRDTAEAILSDRAFLDGKSPRYKALTNASWLTNYIIKTEPGSLSPSYFVPDLEEATFALAARIIDRIGGPDAREQVERHFGVDAVPELSRALEAYGRSSDVYENARDRISTMRLGRERDRCPLYVMLFVMTGCLGDPSLAARRVEKFATSKLSSSFHTQFSDDVEPLPTRQEQAAKPLLLMRIFDGMSFGSRLYPVSPEGTIVGSLPDHEPFIADVEQDVSSNHLLIWRDGNRWLCRDSESTNGTKIISGADKSVYVLAPPKRERAKGWECEDHELLPADIICLGAHTRFLVLSSEG